MESKWYAVYTKSHWEKKVVDNLNKIGIENYCPLNKVLRKWSDRKKLVEEPLFKSYVFVRVSNKQMNAVRLVYGVVNFVYWLGKPAVIADHEIEIIKQFLAEYTNVKLERAVVQVKDNVKIINGPFMDMEGNVVSLNKTKIKVSIPSLQYILTAEIERENITVLKKGNTSNN
jgi:transcription antitermination factor NusG